MTLERIEMDAVEVTVYTFTTPQGYELSGGRPPYEYQSIGMHSTAAYSVDRGPVTRLEGSGLKFTADGITLGWDGIEPIPVEAKEFDFAITRLGDVEGRWEFKVLLE